MQHDARAWLWDVRRAADSIAEFVKDRSFVDYEADLMLRSAAERQLEIAGEALTRLSREAPQMARRLPDLRRAIAMRNALIHGYRAVDDATVWHTIRTDLPVLRGQIEALLAELGDRP
jgi:uncharacterized protein with HEPN domain